MSLELLAWVTPTLGVLIFFILERINNSHRHFDGRSKTFVSIGIVSILTNLFLSVLLLIPLVMLIAPLQIASISQLAIPRTLSFIISFLAIDLIHYINHRLHHQIPLLWKLHRLHHSDRHVDSLTTWLHHPSEIISTFIIVITLFVLFDIPVMVIIIYSILFGLHAAFTHFEILIPERINQYLHYLIITPNTHRLHHSAGMQESNSNFGQILPIWDMLFRTYIRRNNKQLNQMQYGIDDEQTPKLFNISQYLANPFK